MAEDAVSLRSYFEALLRERDERLEKHISAQIQQVKEQYQHIQTALVSADKLELARLDALQREISLQLQARDMAIEKAEASNDKRFESVNEFRAQLADQSSTFMPREVSEALHRDTAAKLALNTKHLDELRGQASGSRAALGVMISVAVVLLMVFTFAANYLTSH